VRDLSCGDLHIYLELEVRRVECGRCGKVKRERLTWWADNPFYTKRFAFFVGRRCRASTIKDVAQEVHLNWDSVKELEKQYMREQLRRVALSLTRNDPGVLMRSEPLGCRAEGFPFQGELGFRGGNGGRVEPGGDGSGWVSGTGDEGCRSSLWPEDEVVGWRDGARSCAEPWRRRWDRRRNRRRPAAPAGARN